MEYLNVPEYYQGYCAAVSDFNEILRKLTAEFNFRKIRLTTALLSEFLDFYVKHHIEIREYPSDSIGISYNKEVGNWIFFRDGEIIDTMVSESTLKKNKKKENRN